MSENAIMEPITWYAKLKKWIDKTDVIIFLLKMYFKSGIVAINPSTQTGGRGRGEILSRKTKQRYVKKKKATVELKLRIVVGSWVLPKQVPRGRTLFSSVGLCGWGAVRWAQARWSWLPRPHWLFWRVMECQASGPFGECMFLDTVVSLPGLGPPRHRAMYVYTGGPQYYLY